MIRRTALVWTGAALLLLGALPSRAYAAASSCGGGIDIVPVTNTPSLVGDKVNYTLSLLTDFRFQEPGLWPVKGDPCFSLPIGGLQVSR